MKCSYCSKNIPEKEDNSFCSEECQKYYYFEEAEEEAEYFEHLNNKGE